MPDAINSPPPTVHWSDELSAHGFDQQDVGAFARRMAEVLALPAEYAERIESALRKPAPLRLIWLNGQDCTGDTEALLRVGDPSLIEVLLDYLSIDYHELFMAPAGAAAEATLHQAASARAGTYALVVEGAIPLAEHGAYCMIGGRAFADIVRELSEHALVTFAVGSCAWDGGLPAAGGGVTEAVGVRELLPRAKVISFPGCPINGENLLAAIVHYLTFGEFPPTDVEGLPLFAYGQTVHARCDRLPHFQAKEFAKEFGDEGYRAGWCLMNLGCKGLYAKANCPLLQFNEGTGWSIGAGHPCIACVEHNFWDTMAPFYHRGRARPPIPGLEHHLPGTTDQPRTRP